MKTKLLVLLLAIAILTTVLCSCEVLEFINNLFRFIPEPNPNDTNIDIDINIGLTTAHVHNESTLPAIDSTCKKTGLTEGKICTDCNKILVPQEIIDLKSHVFDDDKDKTCNNCDFVREITSDIIYVEKNSNGVK